MTADPLNPRDPAAYALGQVTRSPWLRVGFYGLVPPGQCVTSVDPLEVGSTLMGAFGFTYIDGLTMIAEPAAAHPVTAPDQASFAEALTTLAAIRDWAARQQAMEPPADASGQGLDRGYLAAVADVLAILDAP